MRNDEGEFPEGSLRCRWLQGWESSQNEIMLSVKVVLILER